MRRILLLMLLILVLATSGCSILIGDDSSTAQDAKRPPAERCDSLMKKPATGVKISGATVLLADDSASSYTRPNTDHHQDWLDALSAHLPGNGSDLVAMGFFGGAVDWKVTKVTPGKSTDSSRTRNDLQDAQSCLILQRRVVSYGGSSRLR
ncbi:hypothetical protein [Dactylosporangium sp. NPDC051541]|uniref:hypothetical protein n=1 Tax=Dactylosporangium sp. NPDC051541 TaxID=3363977 RepID=UPI0037B1374E